jgi:hypothetical protein
MIMIEVYLLFLSFYVKKFFFQIYYDHVMLMLLFPDLLL